jgi:hypothetical protein
MFEYCKARHTDPSYKWAGSTDYALLDIDSGILFMFSTVYQSGQLYSVTMVPPIKLEEFNLINKVKGKTVRELFNKANKLKGGEVKMKCVKASREEIMSIILKDLQQLPQEVISQLETIVAETF